MASRKINSWNRKYGAVPLSADKIADCTQSVCCAYYELPETERPKTIEALETFFLDVARLRWRSLKSEGKNLISVNGISIANRKVGEDTFDRLSAFDALMRSGSVYHYVKPVQDTHMAVLDALRLISRLPPRDRELALSLFDYGDIIEYAKDMGISAFDAMKNVKAARARLKAYAELTDEDFVEQQNRLAANKWKRSSDSIIREVFDTAKAPKTLDDLSIAYNFRKTDTPFEDPLFRCAAKRAWKQQIGKACPCCHLQMIFIMGRGGWANPRMATIDHILARSLGGTNAAKNLWVICHECNGAKSRYERKELNQRRGYAA